MIGYEHTARARKQQRQLDAAERQARYNGLTPEEKLALVESRPGESRRERARIEKEFESRG